MMFTQLQALWTEAVDEQDLIVERFAPLDMVLRKDADKIAEVEWNGGLEKKNL